MDRREARERARELVAQMTIEERISQLRYDAPAIERLGIPAYNWWGEALHGVARAGQATSFPQAIGMAATFDEELIGEIAGVIADEGRAKYNAFTEHGDRDIYKGLTFWSPNINIFRDPRWGRGQETYGEDPYLSGTLGCAYVRGLQGNGEYMKAAACAKHFAAHSGPEALRHRFNAEVSAKDLGETYLPAFERLVTEAGVEAVMGAYNCLNGEPCCGSKTLLKDTLRGRWHFQGHVVSDCWAIRDFHENHHVTKTPAESAALAVNNGCDLNCGSTFHYLLDAFRQGLVTEERITEACERLYTTRYLLGLFDEEAFSGIAYPTVGCSAHLEVAERAARESIVLLKNDGLLPLDRTKIRTIGVIGPNADSRAALVGNYHGTSSEYITPLEGIRRAAGEGIRILSSEGCGLNTCRIEHLAMENDRLSEAEIVAESSDVVILVVGLDETLEGEEGDTGNSSASGDKEDLLLPAPQRELMRAVAETGRPVIFCLMAGSAIDLSFAEEQFGAILNLWYPGARGGKALGEILFGDVSPSGKLDVTFYRDTDPLPEFTSYSMKNRTYRYLEYEPLYPFGYGLTYGRVHVVGACFLKGEGTESSGTEDSGAPALQNGGAPEGDGSRTGTAPVSLEGMTVRAMVRNDGDRAVRDVVQVYVSCPDSGAAPRNPRLAGFAGVYLAAGEEKETDVPLDRHAFAVVDERGERISGGRRFILSVGTSQPDARSIELTGETPFTLRVEW